MIEQKPSTSKTLSTPTTPKPYYHENCVFNTLTGNVSASGGSGYDSDSSYIIKRKQIKQGN